MLKNVGTASHQKVNDKTKDGQKNLRHIEEYFSTKAGFFLNNPLTMVFMVLLIMKEVEHKNFPDLCLISKVKQYVMK